jgi:CBS domain containing-hemolysin-like protein
MPYTCKVLHVLHNRLRSSGQMDSLFIANAFNDQALILLLVYLTIALGVSFLCSVAEAVLLSVTEPYVESIRKSRPRTSVMLAEFRRSPDRPLTAILTLNTVAHTVGAAGVGHEAAVLFGESWLGVASGIMTLLILILSEIIPKTLGATRWRSLAPMTAKGVTGLTVLLSPLVNVMVRITERLGHRTPGAMSLSEIQALLSIASRSREIDASEASILRNLFRLRERTIRTIMTPRKRVFQLSADMTAAEYAAVYAQSAYSRIPIFGENQDDIVGFVLRMDVLSAGDTSATLRSLIRPLICIPDHFNVATLYSQLIEARSHMAQVINEFGDYEGVATLEDVLESLLGIEINDETDPPKQ